MGKDIQRLRQAVEARARRLSAVQSVVLTGGLSARTIGRIVQYCDTASFLTLALSNKTIFTDANDSREALTLSAVIYEHEDWLQPMGRVCAMWHSAGAAFVAVASRCPQLRYLHWSRRRICSRYHESTRCPCRNGRSPRPEIECRDVLKLTHYLYLSEGDVLGKTARSCPSLRVLRVDEKTINVAALKYALGDQDADERGLVLIDATPTHQWHAPASVAG